MYGRDRAPLAQERVNRDRHELIEHFRQFDAPVMYQQLSGLLRPVSDVTPLANRHVSAGISDGARDYLEHLLANYPREGLVPDTPEYQHFYEVYLPELGAVENSHWQPQESARQSYH